MSSFIKINLKALKTWEIPRNQKIENGSMFGIRNMDKQAVQTFQANIHSNTKLSTFCPARK